MPGVPGLPGMAELPGLPGLPGMAGLPGVAGVAGVADPLSCKRSLGPVRKDIRLLLLLLPEAVPPRPEFE